MGNPQSTMKKTPEKIEIEEFEKNFYPSSGTLVITFNDIKKRIDRIEQLKPFLITQIKNVIFPSNTNITEIPATAFIKLYNMESIILPETIISIGMNAFAGCGSLKEIVIPNSVTYIGPGAFRSCISLKKIKLSEKLNQISSYLFLDCTSLVDLVIPASVNLIGDEPFMGSAINRIFAKNTNIPIINSIKQSQYTITPLAFKNIENAQLYVPKLPPGILENTKYNNINIYLTNELDLKKLDLDLEILKLNMDKKYINLIIPYENDLLKKLNEQDKQQKKDIENAKNKLINLRICQERKKGTLFGKDIGCGDIKNINNTINTHIETNINQKSNLNKNTLLKITEQMKKVTELSAQIKTIDDLINNKTRELNILNEEDIIYWNTPVNFTNTNNNNTINYVLYVILFIILVLLVLNQMKVINI
jgi:hypothetical protein